MLDSGEQSVELSSSLSAPFSKFGREHETFPCDTESGLPLIAAVTPAYWMLFTVHGDDQGKLRPLFARFQRLARLYGKAFPRKEPAQALCSRKPLPIPLW